MTPKLIREQHNVHVKLFFVLRTDVKGTFDQYEINIFYFIQRRNLFLFSFVSGSGVKGPDYKSAVIEQFEYRSCSVLINNTHTPIHCVYTSPPWKVTKYMYVTTSIDSSISTDASSNF